jgi:6-phosphogluconolactonase/glucosamine-6-phosphate isomerase/deaminase
MPDHFRYQRLFPPVEESAVAALHTALLPFLNSSVPVLLGLSGGSAVKVYQRLFGEFATTEDWSHLAVITVDERWGAAGHADSNETQLKAAGVIPQIEKHGGHWVGFLPEKLPSTPEEEAAYIERLNHQLLTLFSQHEAGKIILLSGIGDDGHAFGWLPTQTAEKFTSLFDASPSQIISRYTVDPADSDNPHRERLTLTLATVRRAHQVIAYSVGAGKHPVLKKLLQLSEISPNSFHTLPATALTLAQNPPLLLSDVEL